MPTTRRLLFVLFMIELMVLFLAIVLALFGVLLPIIVPTINSEQASVTTKNLLDLAVALAIPSVTGMPFTLVAYSYNK